MLNISLLAAQFLFYTALPTVYHGAQWGISVSELNSQIKVYKASHHGNYNYADHSEINPDVYVRKTTDSKRLEYYFYNKKLYKIYVVYPKNRQNNTLYRKQVSVFKQLYGAPSEISRDKYFGLEIQHTRWNDEQTALDLRLGAGFIYEVWVDTNAAKQKALQQERTKAI